MVITTKTQKCKVPSKRETIIAVVTDHLMTWRALTVSARRTPQLKERRNHRPGSGTSQNGSPPQNAKPVRRVSALAKCARKDLVSDDHLPPTSIAKTTKRARLRGPTNSGYRRSFRLWAAVRTTPSRSSQCMQHTSVVSIASWHPPKRSKPSTTTSNRLLSVASTGKSISRMKVLTATRPPASIQILATALSSAKPRRPRPLPLSKLHGDGQRCQWRGHTGNCGRTEGGATEAAEEGQHGTNEARSW